MRTEKAKMPQWQGQPADVNTSPFVPPSLRFSAQKPDCFTVAPPVLEPSAPPLVLSVRNPRHNVLSETKLPYTLTHYALTKSQDLTGPITYHIPLKEHPTGYTSGLNHFKVAETVVLGDLHGASQKLLEHAVLTGMVEGTTQTLEAFKVLHQKVVDLLKTDPYLHQQASQIRYKQLFRYHEKLLQKLTWQGSPTQTMTLLGDVIGDRGIGDAFILSMLKRFEDAKQERYPNQSVPAFDVVLSNHDHWAWLRWLEDYTPKTAASEGHWVPSEVKASTLTDKNKGSYIRTLALSQADPELKNHHDTLYAWYFRHMKLLNYDAQRKALMTHASVSKEGLQGLALLLKRNYHQILPPLEEPRHFEQWVAHTNDWFKTYTSTQPRHKVVALLEHPNIAHFVSARDLMLHPEGGYKSPLPAKIATYFIHGHTNIWRQSRMDEAPMPEFTVAPNLAGLPQQKRINLNNSAYKTVDKVLPDENSRMLLFVP
jgi:hypothetical protein